MITTLINQGLALQKQGKLDLALLHFQEARKLNPQDIAALVSLGNLYQSLNQHEQSLNCFERALILAPQDAGIHYNKANALKALERYEEAIESYQKAIEFKSDYADAYYNLGNVLHELGCLERAISAFNKVIILKSSFPGGYYNKALALQDLGNFDESRANYEKTISLIPDYAPAYNNYGMVLEELDHLEEAIENYTQAIKLDPENVLALNNRGNAAHHLLKLDASLKDFSDALKLNPDCADACFNKSLVLLLKGVLLEGWQLYHSRLDIKRVPSMFSPENLSHPLWIGQESLEGKTILLHTEQGLGDVILFSRYAPMVAKLGAKVTLLVPTVLKDLLSDIDGVHQVIDAVETNRPFDFQCPLMSLPLAFKTELDSIPPPTKNLLINKDKAQYFEQQLGPKTKPRIGICWSSVSSYKGDHKRSVNLEQFLTALPTEGFDYICLQKEIKGVDQELLRANPQIAFYGDYLDNFADTAALIEQVDLVVSTCTSVPHLAATLHKPTWILLPFSPDWRWMLHRSDSPWYPSVKLIRQQSLGDWGGVMERVHRNLIEVCNSIDTAKAVVINN